MMQEIDSLVIAHGEQILHQNITHFVAHHWGKSLGPRMTLRNMKKKTPPSDSIIVTSSATTQRGAVKRFGRRTDSQKGTVIRMLIIIRV